MLFWVLLGAGAGYGLVRVFLGYPPRPESFGRLSRREAAFLAAASEAMYPRGGVPDASGSDAQIPRYVDRYLGLVPARMRRSMRMLFFLMEHATLLFPASGGGGWRRFSSLSAEQRICVLEDWGRSRLLARRIVFASLRAILTMGYFANPAVLRDLGLAPFDLEPPVCEADLLYPRVGRSQDTIRCTREQMLAPRDPTPLDPEAPAHPDYLETPP